MNTQHVYWCVGWALAFGSYVANAQEIPHSDVFFTYGIESKKIEIAPQDGLLAIPQIMPVGGFFAQANENPGFFSETDVGGGTGPNDIVGYHVEDDLIFWSDGAFLPPKPTTEIRIINNPGFVEDTVVGTGIGKQPASFDPLLNSIGQSGSNGNFHSHVDFRLEPLTSDPDETPLFGAYGLKLRLSSDNADMGDSDPFFIVFSFGIENDQFTEALNDFNELLLTNGGVLGDFDLDGSLTATDIDMLSAEVLAGNNTASFDINDDQLVNQLDRTKWVEELAGTFYGDTNLNGRVQFADFLTLSGAFGGPGGWSQGDSDGNGQIQFADFLSLSGNFGKGEVQAAASVPEPSGTHSVVIWLTLLAGLWRGRISRK